MKVTELQGATLDYWVAKADELDPDFRHSRWVPVSNCRPENDVDPIHAYVVERGWSAYPDGFPNLFNPSCDWLKGGPILARMIESGEFCVWENSGSVIVSNNDPECIPCKRPADWSAPEVRGEGPTLLIAAMRAYVALKFGDEVPDEASQ